MFTKEDIQFAWFASRIDLDAEANQRENQTFEAAVTDCLWQFAQIADTPERRKADLRAEYDNGKAILKKALLLIGDRYQLFTANPYPLTSPDAPTIKAPAGHIATSEAVREVTLLSKDTTADSYLTPAEVAAATGQHQSTWRNRCARGEIPGAFKKGKQWLIPRSILQNYEKL